MRQYLSQGTDDQWRSILQTGGYAHVQALATLFETMDASDPYYGDAVHLLSVLYDTSLIRS